MEVKDIKNKIAEIINNKGNGKYFIHRTSIGPVFYDVQDGKLYTDNEYYELCSTKGHDYVDENLYVIEDLEYNELMQKHVLDVGAGWSISEQYFRETYNRNFTEQINKFFSNGLYAVETSIDRTATSLEEGPNHNILSIDEQRERLGTLLSRTGFGMNTSEGNALLGALSNREVLDTLLILEIPEECFGNLEQVAKLFEKSDDRLEIMTAYRGLQTLDTIIPRDYIKGAFYVGKNDILFEENEHFNGERKVEVGIYDGKTIQEIFDDLGNTDNVSSNQLEKILDIITNDFNVDNDLSKYESRISFVRELLPKVKDPNALKKLETIIEEISDRLKNPLERSYGKIMKLQFSQMNPDEISNVINEFVLNGSNVLNDYNNQNNYFDFGRMLEIYENGLKVLSTEALIELSNDYRANNARAMVHGKLADISRLQSLLKQIEPLDELEIFGELPEEKREEYNRLLDEIKQARELIGTNKIENIEKKAFLAEEIGKATINTTVDKKDKSQARVDKDQAEIQTLKDENKSEISQ